MPAFAFEYEHAKREGVRFIWHSVITRINGGARVENVICQPAREIVCDTVIIAIGQSRGPLFPGVELQDGDWMEVRYEGFGRGLRNPVRVEPKGANRLISVRSLA